jgi:transposase-like protein
MPVHSEADRRLLSPGEVARRWGVSTTSLRRWARDGFA